MFSNVQHEILFQKTEKDTYLRKEILSGTTILRNACQLNTPILHVLNARYFPFVTEVVHRAS